MRLSDAEIILAAAMAADALLGALLADRAGCAARRITLHRPPAASRRASLRSPPWNQLCTSP
jgi:hypothetical protein